MPRRTLALLTALVLALHWLVLEGLPLRGPGAGEDASPALAFNTRMLAPPAPPPPPGPDAAAAQAPANPPAAPAPRPRPARKPAPPPPAAEPADSATASPSGPSDPSAPMGAQQAPADTGADTAPPAKTTSATDAVAPPAQESAQPQQPSEPPVAAPPDPATATAAPPQPPADSDDGNAGVEIRPPGAGGQAPSTTPPPVRLPAPAQLTFEVTGQVKKFHYSANAQLMWRHDGARYEARQEIKAFLFGSRSQTSTGTVTSAGLQPQRFGDRARSEQAAHFDFAAGKATFSANSPPAAIREGAQDRLSVFIQLGALLAAAPERYPPGTQITLTTVSARNADRWTFTVEGTETLDLPAGPTPALKLQRLPRKEHDQKAELWLGTEAGYLPVRIRLSQSGGDFADLRLSERGAP